MECLEPDCSQKLDGLTHGGLNVDSLEVLPSLLEEGDQEVEAHHEVGDELFVSHILTSGADTHVGDLSELELDGTTDVLDLENDGRVLVDHSGEHLNSVKNGSNDDGDLLEDGVGGNEEGVLLGPLLDEFLVLVELLEGIEIGDIDVDSLFLALDLMLLISDDADLEVGAGEVGESDGTDETLVLLWVVILKGELELNGLSEFSLLVVFTHGLNGVSDEGFVDLGGHSILLSRK